MRLLVADDYPCRDCEVKHCHQNCQKFNTWLDTIIEAEPVVHGEWVFDALTAQHGTPYRCSICKEEHDDTHNFCPNCGAKMGKGGDA